MNLPNTLTLLRIFFVPLLVAVLVEQGAGIRHNGVLLVSNELVALGIFLAAAVTDFLDGYLARRWGQITTVGTLLDPIADKLLVSAALVSLVQIQRVPAWVVILIIGREFAVSGLRSIAAAEGYTIRASELGKTKMVGQVLAVTLVILSVKFAALGTVANGFLMLVMVFGLISAVDYFRKFWRKVDDEVKARRRTELLLREQQERRAAKAVQ